MLYGRVHDLRADSIGVKQLLGEPVCVVGCGAGDDERDGGRELEIRATIERDERLTLRFEVDSHQALSHYWLIRSTSAITTDAAVISLLYSLREHWDISDE